MTHRSPFKEMFDLSIGDQLVMAPLEGETVEAALKRIKVRASKYRSEGRSFRVTQHEESICVVRVPFGTTNKLANWEAMTAGDVLLLKDRPTPKEIASAKNTINYLNSVKVAGSGFWSLEHRADGRLFVRCVNDRQGRFYEPPRQRFNETPLTPAQEAAREARNWRASAKHQREEARRASPGMSQALLRIADAFEAKAQEWDEQAREHTMNEEAMSSA